MTFAYFDHLFITPIVFLCFSTEKKDHKAKRIFGKIKIMSFGIIYVTFQSASHIPYKDPEPQPCVLDRQLGVVPLPMGLVAQHPYATVPRQKEIQRGPAVPTLVDRHCSAPPGCRIWSFCGIGILPELLPACTRGGHQLALCGAQPFERVRQSFLAFTVSSPSSMPCCCLQNEVAKSRQLFRASVFSLSLPCSKASVANVMRSLHARKGAQSQARLKEFCWLIGGVNVKNICNLCSFGRPNRLRKIVKPKIGIKDFLFYSFRRVRSVFGVDHH